MLILTSFSYAEGIKLTHSASPNIITVGDRFFYSLTITSNKSEKIKVPEVKNNINVFEILTSELKFEDVNDLRVYKYNAELTAFKTGEFSMPSININMRNVNYYLPEIPIKIKSILPIDPQLKGSMGSLSIDLPWGLYNTVILIILLVVSILFYFFVYKEKKEMFFNTKEEKILSPSEKAIQYLSDLREEHLIEKGKEKEHYLSVTDIIKEYLSVVFSSKMQEMTSDEIFTTLESKTDIQTFKRIKNLLEQADRVKFAKDSLSKDEHEQNFKRAIDIVERLSIL